MRIGATWLYLAWRDRQRWLAVLTAGCAVAGFAGSLLSTGSTLSSRTLAYLGRFLPRDTFGWGVLTVVAAFALLAAGARRSLGKDSGDGPSRPPVAGPPRPRGREWAAVSMALMVFSLTALVSVHRSEPAGSAPPPAGFIAFLAAAAALAAGARAVRICAHEDKDPAGQWLAGLAVASGALAAIMCLVAPSPERTHVERAAPPVKGDQAHPAGR